MFIRQNTGRLRSHSFVIDCTTGDTSETAEVPNNFFYLVLLKS